jgi:predicted RNA polymerase sigma factor
VACHAEAETWEATDWPQILLLYDALYALLPTPVVGLHRAIALRQVAGPAVALAELDALAGPLAGYHLLHATRAQPLRDLGRASEARVADERALGLTGNPAERAFSNNASLRHPTTDPNGHQWPTPPTASPPRSAASSSAMASPSPSGSS